MFHSEGGMYVNGFGMPEAGDEKRARVFVFT